MRFTIPFAPVSAGRPNWNGQTGYATNTHMPKRYREWRTKVGAWFEHWLEDTNYQLLHELYRLSPQASLENKNEQGREPIVTTRERHRYTKDKDGNKVQKTVKENRLARNFWGFKIKVVLCVEESNVTSPYPLSGRTGDLDNYYKAVTDMIFESDTFKRVFNFNDRWIQEATVAKLAVPKGNGKIVVDIQKIEGDFDV